MNKFSSLTSVAELFKALDECASVRDALACRAELLIRIAQENQASTSDAVQWLRNAQRAIRKDWNEADFYCDDLESSFAINWQTAGLPVFVLTDSMAALLSLTRSPPLDLRHAPHPAFLIEVPKRYVPLESKRPTITLAIESYSAMGIRDGAGNIGVIPDGSTTSRWAQTGGNRVIDEAVSSKSWMLISIRIASNVIAYLNEHRPGSESAPRISKDGSDPVFEVRPPRDVIIDRAFRDAASALVHAGNVNAAKGVLAHYVRGHWRNQAVGPALNERRLTWVRPHRRGDESLGRVVQRIESLRTKADS